MTTRRTILAAIPAAMLATRAYSQAWPSQPIEMIVPWPAGGNGDALGRALQPRLSAVLGQPVLVQNQPGVGSSLALAKAARAGTNGYTLAMVTAAATINMTLQKSPGYDLVKDFVPVAMAGTLPLILVVNAGLPVSNVKELIAYAKANPGKLNYATAGIGTGGHLAAEAFKQLAGVDLVAVHYKGAAPAKVDVASGNVHVFFDGIPSSLPLIQAGKLKLLGVTTDVRFIGMPEVPTVAEAGLPGMDVSVWFGFSVPRGTSPEIVNRYNRELNAILATAEVKEMLLKVGFQPLPQMSVADLEAYTSRDITKWAKVIKDGKITAES
jgi:tripartite-type tricarboxylate transporter receptor subunit TctC